MAHKALIGGTAYEITGGKTLVGGTAYSIDKGKTLVGGTAYDISFSLIPEIGTPLNDCSPAQIQAVAQAGLASNYWAVGDTIGIALNGTVGVMTFSNETYYAVIIGFNHNSEIEGGNSIHFQFGKNSHGIDIAFRDSCYGSDEGGYGVEACFHMNLTDTNSGGWAGSYMRTAICPMFLAVMPSDWQKVIVACTKYTNNTGGTTVSSHTTATSDKIWLLAEFEVFGASTHSHSSEAKKQKQYDYYVNGNGFIRNKQTDTSASTYGIMHWLRNPRRNANVHFCIVVGGKPNVRSSNDSFGFAPAFMVA